MQSRLAIATILASILLPETLSAVRGAEMDQPSQRPIERLLNEAWREPPSSIDVTFTRRMTRPPKSLAAIRSAVEQVYAATRKSSPYKDDAVAEKRELEAEIQRITQQQNRPRTLRQRIRCCGESYRLDQTVLSDFPPDDEFVAAGKFETSFINTGKTTDGFFDSSEYSHRVRIATELRLHTTPRWTKEEIWLLTSNCG